MTSRHLRPSRQGANRRGALTFLVLLFLMTAVFLVMLVLNWNWLVLNNRDIQRRSDILALSAVERLLDEQLLEDRAGEQWDDKVQAEDGVDWMRRANNRVAPPSSKLDSKNVTVIPGRVASVESPVFFSDTPYNALRVELHRYATGPNPVLMLMRGFGFDDAADITTVGVACLDSRVVGFRPTSTVATPLAPLAIRASAWFADRPAGGTDSNLNNVLELDVVLRPFGGDGLANGALVDVGQTLPLNLQGIPDLVRSGVLPSDLADPVFGPATPGSPLSLQASNVSPTNTDMIVKAFDDVANDAVDTRRIFPIYQGPFVQPLNVVGFVAASVLSAENIGGAADQLCVTVEPAFLVHFTAETDPGVPENIYIHKIRLVQ